MKIKGLLVFFALFLYMAVFTSSASAVTYISTAEQLMGITDMSETYYLTKDIDLSGKKWVPLGGTTDATCFTGVFDGRGYTISHLSGKNGLFAMNAGTVRNVTLDETCAITSGTGPYVGAIAGYNKGTIENCVNHASISATSRTNTGGICGSNSSGTVKKCVNTGSIKASGKPVTESVVRAGGICGYMSGSATIDQCWNQGSILATYSAGANNSSINIYAGGIVGEIDSSGALVSNTYNTGTVTAEANQYGSGALAGGITACMEGVSEIRTSYNVGTVTADPMYSSDLYRSWCFAIAGLKTSGTHVSTPVGTCSNCYYLDGSYVKIAQNPPQTAGTTACTAAQLKQKSTFSGFNFSTIWMIDGGSTYRYPVLRATHDCTHSYRLTKDSATCAAAGQKIYTCDYCGGTKRETSPALAHSFTSKVSAVEASAANCTEAATYYVQCDNCSAVSDKLTVSVGEAVGHSWEDATCTTPKTCSVCGDMEGTALNHDWSAWQLTQAPTYIRPGEESRTCGRCCEPQNQPIAPTGQATADNIRKEQDGGSITLDGVPEDMIVLVAAYRNGQLLFVQVLNAGAIRSGSVPESVTWDTVKVLFVTADWIPVARAEEYFA